MLFSQIERFQVGEVFEVDFPAVGSKNLCVNYRNLNLTREFD